MTDAQALPDDRIADVATALRGADALISLSQPGPDVIKPEWVRTMARNAIVFACANPVPEIYPYAAKEAGALVVATGRGDFPNQVNNSLGFPGILKGALLVRAKKITDAMAIAAAETIAGFADRQGLAPDRIMPRMTDEAVFSETAAAVARQAAADGVARRARTPEQVQEMARQDIAEATQDSIRRAISVVTQDTSLLHRSIAANIGYGRPGATPAEIESAARRAHAHEFVMDLMDWRGRTGYDAHVGERGVKLSGGQRQRIALARVILKDAPILVLDEATSALDSEVEAAILDTLYGVMEGKTVIAIAHRLSTIARMDRILVLDDGRIVEEGSHAQLLAQDGLYAGFWARQSGGFIGTDPQSEAAE